MTVFVLDLTQAREEFFSKASKMENTDYDFNEITAQCLSAICLFDEKEERKARLIEDIRATRGRDGMVLGDAVEGYLNALEARVERVDCRDGRGLLDYDNFSWLNDNLVLTVKIPPPDIGYSRDKAFNVIAAAVAKELGLMAKKQLAVTGDPFASDELPPMLPVHERLVEGDEVRFYNGAMVTSIQKAAQQQAAEIAEQYRREYKDLNRDQ